MCWIQCDVPEHWVGWSRSGHFLWVDSIGNKSILKSLCASLLLWPEIGSLQSVPPESWAEQRRLHTSSLLIRAVTLQKWHLTLAHVGFLCALKVVFALSAEKIPHFYYWRHSRTNKAEVRGVVFSSAPRTIASRVTSWGLSELLASLLSPGQAGNISRAWIRPLTSRFQLLLFSANPEIN